MRKQLRGLPVPDPKTTEEISLMVQPSLDGGHFPDMDPTRIPPNGVALSRNAVIRDGRIKRRPGTTLYTPSQPNANKVLFIMDYVDANGNIQIVRHTRNSVHYAGSSWTNVVGTLHGADSNQIRSFIANYNYLFTNDGVDPIQLVNFGGATFAALSANAPNVKRAFGFDHRVVGINVFAGVAPYTNADPAEVVWSGLDNYSQFDFSIDISAGFKHLVDTPSDESDQLMDGFGFDNVALLVRQHSIWMMIPQAVSTEPYQIFCKYPRIGCVCDYGAADIDNGIMFPDLAHKDVYIITIQNNGYYQSYNLEAVATPAVKRFMMNTIKTPNKVFSSYDISEKEYTLFVPSETSNEVFSYTYNFINKSWTYGEHDSVSCVMDVSSQNGSLTIDQLVGTIDGLTGTIDGLSAPNSQLPVRLEGTLGGDILVVNPDITTDVVYGTTPVNYEEEIRSKALDLPTEEQDVTATFYTIRPFNVGTVTEEWSRDDGNSWVFGKTFTINNQMLGRSILLTFRKNFHCNRFMSRLRSTTVAFDILSYEVVGTPKAGQQTTA